MQVEKQTTWRILLRCVHLGLCVQGQLFGTHHALVYSLVTRGTFRYNQLPQGPRAPR